MEKERLRIPSDSSSGSSSHGATSPNLASLHTAKPAYVLKSNLGPPPNSPANFSPLLPASSPYSLPPPPGLPHPGLGGGGMYQMPSCPSTSYQNINYSSGMPGSMGNHSHLTSRFPPVQPQPLAAGQYEFINGYGVQNSMLQQTQTNSPPPGYNYFGSSHHTPQSCPPHTQSHACGPLNSSHHVAYNQQNQSGEPIDLEKHLKLILSSSNMAGVYDKTCFGGRDYMSMQSHMSALPQDDLSGGILPGHLQKDEKLNSASVDGVMNPIIENLVGSMSMCNGTYTHFGPSVPLTNKLQNGQADILSNETNMDSHVGCMESERKALFSKVAVTCASNEMKDSKENMFGIPAVGVKQQSVYQLGIEPSQQDTTHESRFFALENVNSLEPSMNPRTSSPREPAESSSRPQTPGKPSYLEVLTKAGFKNQQSGPSSRKISSTSSSPVQSSFTANDNVPSLTHRKSVEYFVGPATSSTPSSSCPSASSSPATKPRNMTSGMKGKENVSGAALKQANVSKNSPSNSPTHSTNQNQLPKGKSMQPTNIGSERKVLASQNSTSSNARSNSKAIRNGKLTGDKSFELGDGNQDGGECGWKTYTSRGRNNNLNSVGNKNSQKRTSNGHCSPEPPIASNVASFDDEEEDMDERKQGSNDDTVTEKRPASATVGTSNTGSSVTHSRKQREKEKQRSKKEDRNCVSRRLEILVCMWLTHMISALTWLWSLITDVASLSASLVASLMQDFYLWAKTKVLPSITDRVTRIQREVCQVCHNGWHNWKTKVTSLFSREAPKTKKTTEDNSNSSTGSRIDENILSLLGPERNIVLPANGDEALKRLLSVKGQDPYSILGVRSDCSDETIRRYYKRQAVLVHPDKNLIVGAEEAFKILARAFEMVGDPIKRAEYHQKLMEAQAKEKFCGEIGNLLEQLRKKMEAASSTIRCTKCNSRHKKNVTDRPLFAARYCSQCRIHHGAREGELWAERGGWFGISWNYFACMDAHVWEINEWARCQKTNLKHIKADAHCVMYRLVAGGNNHQNHNQHCHGNGTAFEEGAGSEADEWDSLINNLYKAPAGSSFGKSTTVPGKAGCCNATGLNNNGTASNNQAAGRRRKGKRNK